MRKPILTLAFVFLFPLFGAKQFNVGQRPFTLVPGGGGTITLDQNSTGVACASGSCTSATVTLTGQAANTGVLISLLFCADVSCVTTPGSSPITSIGDGVDANLAILNNGTTTALALGTQSMATYGGTSTAGGSLTYTVSFSTTVYYVTILASSWTNLVPSTALDQVGVVNLPTLCSSSPCIITTAGNISQSNEFVYSTAKFTSGTISAGAGWTGINAANPDDEYAFGGTSGNTVMAAWTSSTATQYVGIVATFK